MAGPVVAAASSLGMVQLNVARKVVFLHQVRHLSAAQQTEKIYVRPILWNRGGINIKLSTTQRTVYFNCLFHVKIKFPHNSALRF